MEKIVNAFLARRPGLKDAGHAESQCQIASRGLHEQLLTAGVDANLFWVRGHRVQPAKASPRALASPRHMVVGLPGGAFVDVTRRQFEPTGSHPRYYESEADLAADWREIDDGPPDGSVDDERWRLLGLAPWTLGVSGKGVVLATGSVHTWSTAVGGAPHHEGGLRVLQTAPEDVACYFVIRPSGAVKVFASHDDFAPLIVAADPRLTIDQTPGLSFEADD